MQICLHGDMMAGKKVNGSRQRNRIYIYDELSSHCDLIIY